MMKKVFRYTLGLLLVLCCAASRAGAQDEGGNPAHWCRNGAFTRDSEVFRTARVTGRKGSRVYFGGDDEGCPGPSAKCRQKAYVVPGDEVLTSRAFGDWVCAWYQPARGSETVGWLPAQQLSVTEPPANPPLAAWLGAWGFYDNSLRLGRARKAGALRVEGDATWVGVNPGNVHVGDVSGEAAPEGNVLKVGGGDEYDCRLTLRLVGAYLVASDNRQCGGANVTFDGVYKRKRKG
ncbi:MAG TPA: hypothetical protein VF588_16970 [Pyrinomonadaceae bacterium]